MTVLYNCRHDGDQYRITKFVDGNPESSYLCTTSECTCPASARPTCRHRQMLPQFIDRHLVNSHLFWNHDDGGFSCDFEGNPARETVPAGQDTDVYGVAPFVSLGGLDMMRNENTNKRAKLTVAEQTVRTDPARATLPPANWRRM